MIGVPRRKKVEKSYKFRVWNKVPEGSTFIFGDTRMFLYNTAYDKPRVASLAKISSHDSAISIEHWLATD